MDPQAMFVYDFDGLSAKEDGAVSENPLGIVVFQVPIKRCIF